MNPVSHHAPLIELTRGGTLECQHFGSVAVVNTAGKLLAHAGDPQWLTFTRSTLKALQALPFVEANGTTHFNFTTQQIALLCASHSGEVMHTTQVQGMLDQAGLTYKVLRCGCHMPMFTELRIAAPEGFVADERHNNCSGKHAGFVKPALYAATVEVLDQLGWMDEAQRTLLEPWRARRIVNAREMLVGERVASFKLTP